MKKVLNAVILLPLMLVVQTLAADESAAAKAIVSKDTIATVLSKAGFVLRYCATGVKQGATFVGSKASDLARLTWEKMPEAVKTKIAYAWEKTTQTTGGKVASATAGTAIVVAAIYKLSQQLHFRSRAVAH